MANVSGGIQACFGESPDVDIRTTFVFRPGGVAAGNVYTSWALLYADYLLSAGPVIISIDSSIVTPTVMPAGAYTFRDDTVMQGDYFLGSALELADGVTWGNVPFIDFGLAIRSVSTAPIVTMSAVGINVVVSLDNYSSLEAAGAAPFFEQDSGVFVLAIELRFGSQFVDSVDAVVHLTSPGAGIAYVHFGVLDGTNATGQLQDDTFRSAGGNVQTDIELSVTSGQISFVQPAYASALFAWGAVAIFDSDENVIYRPTDGVKIAGYTATPSEVVQCNPTAGAFTVTLPAGTDATRPRYPGSTIVVKNVSTSANVITVDPSGADTIDSIAAPGAFTMAGSKLSATFVWDGISNWMVI